VLPRLAAGSVNLTTLRLLFKHLTAENHHELLAASLHKSKRDVERLIAARFPQPALPLSVRKVPSAPVPVASAVPVVPRVLEAAATAIALPSSSPVPSRPVRPAIASPSAEDQYHVRFTASGVTWDKLQAAQDLLRHAIPSGDVSEIFGRALDLLLEDLARRKFGATTRPRRSKGTKEGSRHIPNEVKRSVWVRDCGRCAFIGISGRRCTQRSRLEFHHVHPYGDGGEATVENIQLRCQRHNLYEAERHYGPIRQACVVREVISGSQAPAPEARTPFATCAGPVAHDAARPSTVHDSMAIAAPRTNAATSVIRTSQRTRLARTIHESAAHSTLKHSDGQIRSRKGYEAGERRT
jgi:hypothetical protein